MNSNKIDVRRWIADIWILHVVMSTKFSATHWNRWTTTMKKAVLNFEEISRLEARPISVTFSFVCHSAQHCWYLEMDFFSIYWFLWNFKLSLNRFYLWKNSHFCHCYWVHCAGFYRHLQSNARKKTNTKLVIFLNFCTFLLLQHVGRRMLIARLNWIDSRWTDRMSVVSFSLCQ